MKVSEMIQWLQKQDQEAIVQVAVGSIYFETFREAHAEYYPKDEDGPALILIGGDTSEWQ